MVSSSFKSSNVSIFCVIYLPQKNGEKSLGSEIDYRAFLQMLVSTLTCITDYSFSFDYGLKLVSVTMIELFMSFPKQTKFFTVDCVVSFCRKQIPCKCASEGNPEGGHKKLGMRKKGNDDGKHCLVLHDSFWGRLRDCGFECWPKVVAFADCYPVRFHVDKQERGLVGVDFEMYYDVDFS